MTKDYLLEIKNAKKEYTEAWTGFSDKLNEWEDEHESMGNFSINLDYKTKNEVRIQFIGEENIDIVKKACEDFNLEVYIKYVRYNKVSEQISTVFLLKHKDKPNYIKIRV